MRLWVYPNHIRLTPAVRGSCTSRWMEIQGPLINPGTVLADVHSLDIVMLMGCHKFDAAVAMPVVVPILRICKPQEGGDEDAQLLE